MQRKKTVIENECNKCGHIWIQRGLKTSITCPKCNRVTWDEPKDKRDYVDK